MVGEVFWRGKVFCGLMVLFFCINFFKINKNVDDVCWEEIFRVIVVFNDNMCFKWEFYLGSGKDYVEFFMGGISLLYVGNI